VTFHELRCGLLDEPFELGVERLKFAGELLPTACQ